MLFPQVTKLDLLWVNLAPQEGKKNCEKQFVTTQLSQRIVRISLNPAVSSLCFFPECYTAVLCSHLKLCFRVPAEISSLSRFHKPFKMFLLDHLSLLFHAKYLCCLLPYHEDTFPIFPLNSVCIPASSPAMSKPLGFPNLYNHSLLRQRALRVSSATLLLIV